MKFKKRILTVWLVASLFLIGLGMLIIPASVDAAYTGTVTINSDGSVTPSGAPIDVEGKQYKLTDDIDGMLMIKKSNVEVNGMGYSIIGDGTDYGLLLDNVKGVSIKNFYVYDAKDGIYLEASCKCTIKDNTVSDSIRFGITAWDDSDGNTIKDNYVTGNNAGIALIYYSDDNVVKDNTVTYNGYGLDTFPSDENMFKDNIVTYQSRWGISFRYSGDNVAMDNYVDTNNGPGITIYRGTGGHIVKENVVKNCGSSGVELFDEGDILVIDNEIYDCYIGIGSWNTWDITIKCNYITGSGAPGIYIDTAIGHYVHGNEIVENTFGIYFWNSDETLEFDNVITCNLIKGNVYGIYTDDYTFGSYIAYDCGGNTLHHNNIIDNIFQVYEGFDNIWDDGKGEGNYWSDYTGEDTNDDGVGDTMLPHNGVDNYPLMDQC